MICCWNCSYWTPKDLDGHSEITNRWRNRWIDTTALYKIVLSRWTTGHILQLENDLKASFSKQDVLNRTMRNKIVMKVVGGSVSRVKVVLAAPGHIGYWTTFVIVLGIILVSHVMSNGVVSGGIVSWFAFCCPAVVSDDGCNVHLLTLSTQLLNYLN